MKNVMDRLIEKIIEMQNPTCVGLDTVAEYLPGEMLTEVRDFKDVSAAIFEFNKNIIDSVCDIVPAVKIQSACYEMYGGDGVKCFSDTAAYAKKKGLFVIADCKRNDIGNTAGFYARAYLGETRIAEKNSRAAEADYLTVNGYLGTDGIKPFTDACVEYGKGIFVLVKTSNPSGGEFQNIILADGKTVYEYMGGLVEKWGNGCIGDFGYSSVGAVVGATHPQEAEILRGEMRHTFFLIPGYGAQGGNADMIKCCFDGRGLGGIVNNSRGIICAYKKAGGTYFGAARNAAAAMQKDLVSAIGKIGRLS